MGNVTRILITGASGFIGRATVDAALAAGLDVVAVQRQSGADRPGVTYVSTDLTVQDCVPVLADALNGCDAVIHLAAAMTGAASDHKRLTIGGTEHLIEAMRRARVAHLTLASSIAVFDTSHVPIGGDLTDDCPLENPSLSRDVYSGAKVQQEALVRAARLGSTAILRPGIVYDADHLWNAHLGVGFGPVLLRIGGEDPLPMCHVDRCAAALVHATVHKVNDTFTILDPRSPTRGQVIAALRQTGWPKQVVPLPWQILWSTARILRPFSAKLPGLLRENVLRQRGLPMGNRMKKPFGADVLPDPSPDWGATT
ncbi:NAD(P)-dependent oxidoreductase [Marivita sp. S6314]|uniref:NAD-dependent epimerase/dehydratase family protein n=1 Tax=Marivita sp. S6314 TaxID=2926406 RepID=UPI001FF2DB75|nr:NAD(P)-dependent oxidoreductase [Marivita sp. S6314]MCK0151693.1 NAD(P)-dependent oxidoreductase [Marivita sp. S6314]